MIGLFRRLFGRQPHHIEIVGRDFNGRDAVVKVPIPENAGPGYYEFEYLQDGGGGAICGPVIYAQSFEDAVRNGQKYVTQQGFACQFAYGNQPERVRRLPDELQGLPLAEAKAAWKEHPLYNAEMKASDRINPWVWGPVVSGRAGL